MWILIFGPERMMRAVKTGCFCVLLFILYTAFFGAAATKCSSTNSCPGTQHCCRQNNVCRNNYVNEPCWYSSHCAPGEYCCEGKCTLDCPSCSYDSHCLSEEKCCGPSSVGENLNSTCETYCFSKLRVDYSDCPGFQQYCCAGVCNIECSFCHNDSECRSSEVCCGLHLYNKGHCAKSCVNSCKFHHHCPTGQFCCGPGKVGKCATSCVGKFCQHDYRCASGEFCCSDAACCVGKRCEDKLDCGTGETCCDRAKGKGKCATSCIGKSCKKYGSHWATRDFCCSFSGTCGLNCIGQVYLSDFNCAPKETCCGLSEGHKGTCGRFCAGESCKNDGHCGSSEYCCGANATCASNCAEQMCTSRHHCATGEICCGNAPSYLRKCGKSCINYYALDCLYGYFQVKMYV